MWLLIFLFFFITLVIAWNFFGYFILIWFMGLFRKKETPEIPSSLPTISVVIPFFNEEKQIISKLENIRKLDYPKNLLEVFFVDGGSSDKTVGLLSEAISKDEPYKIVKCPKAGKIEQLNRVLPQLKGAIIINTDVDARLADDVLKWVAAEFSTADDILVVGAYCSPVGNAIEVERYYWSSQNKGRFLESDAGSSSIVIAQCYAFRKGLIRTFPEDVVADDVYIAFRAHALGGRTVYSRHAVAIETRCPQGYSDFIPHKFRKGNAFLRESLRFLYLLPQMSPFCKMMFVTRITQQLFLPWALIFWFLTAGVLLTMFRHDIVIFALVALALLFMLTSTIFYGVKLPDGDKRYPLRTMVRGYCLTLAIMLATGISYLFFKQKSEYRRIKNNV